MDASAAASTVQSVLDGPRRRILAAFTDNDAISREMVAERSGYAMSTSSFKNALGSLVTLGMLTKPSPGMVDLAAWVRELL